MTSPLPLLLHKWLTRLLDGELRFHSFDKTHLGPNSVFVDLGSGVGNCVVQAALAYVHLPSKPPP